VALEDLYWMKASLTKTQQRPVIQMYARATVYRLVVIGDRCQGRPLATRWWRRAVASTWPLMR